MLCWSLRGPLALLIGVVTAGILPVGADQARPANPAISGLVIDGETDRPIAGALVTIGTLQGGRGGMLVMTDQLGRFVFPLLPRATEYSLQASKFGYLDGRLGQASANGPSRSVTVSAGEWLGDLRIRLWRSSSLSGRVTDERGDPFVGIRVRVLQRVFGAGREHLAAGPATLTDDRGAYRIAGLHPGRYVVHVPSVQATVPANAISEAPVPADERSQPVLPPSTRRSAARGGVVLVFGDHPTFAGAASAAYPLAFYPGSRTLAGATWVDVGYGDALTGLDVSISPVPVATIRGRVEGTAGFAINTLLRLLPPGLESLGFGSAAATTYVDSEGTFVFLDVPIGQYTLMGSRRTGQLTTTNPAPSNESFTLPAGFRSLGAQVSRLVSVTGGASFAGYSSGGPPVTGQIAVNVSAPGVSEVRLPLTPASSITGRLLFGDGAGSVVGLRLEPAGGDASLGVPATRIARAADESSVPFTIDGVLPGRYRLALVTNSDVVIESIAAGGRDVTHESIDVTAGDPGPVSVRVTARTAQLSGAVRAAGGPAVAAAVLIFPTNRSAWRDYGFTPTRIASVLTNVDGTYAFPRLPAGEYYVAAVAAGEADEWKHPAYLESLAPMAERVRLDWAEHATLDLSRQRAR